MKKLQKILAEKGIEQKTLAKAVDVSPTVINRMIKGTRMPSLAVVKDIAKTLDVTIDELVD